MALSLWDAIDEQGACFSAEGGTYSLSMLTQTAGGLLHF